MPDDPWRCGYCYEHFPVPSLARICEARHEDAPDAAANHRAEG